MEGHTSVLFCALLMITVHCVISPSSSLESTNNSNELTEMYKEKIRQMMQHAWDNYVHYAWGKDELKPISKQGTRAYGTPSLGRTIVGALDTMYIMGMHDEFKQGRDWIAENFDIDSWTMDLSVYDTNVHFVGGLLSCYFLSGDGMFLDKAVQIAAKLLPVFETPTGIPKAVISFMNGYSKNYGWASGGCSILAEVGGLRLEMSCLSDLTGNNTFREKVEHIQEVINKMEKPEGLYPNFISTKGGWCQNHMSIGGMGDTFYEYLLKAWLQSGREDQEARQLFDDAMHNMIQHMLKVSPGGLMYISDMKFDRLENKMDHLGCFSAGLFALAAHTQKDNTSERYMEIAEGIANTCHEAYSRTALKLGPEAFRFQPSAEATAVKSIEKNYQLRPEVVESYFILWRLTKNPKYREWGWEVVEALEKNCRTPNGYTGVANVYSEYSAQDDVQHLTFLEETLKYLYLLFSDDDVISLNKWVFNTKAHPLPIGGINPEHPQIHNPSVEQV